MKFSAGPEKPSISRDRSWKTLPLSSGPRILSRRERTKEPIPSTDDRTLCKTAYCDFLCSTVTLNCTTGLRSRARCSRFCFWLPSPTPRAQWPPHGEMVAVARVLTVGVRRHHHTPSCRHRSVLAHVNLHHHLRRRHHLHHYVNDHNGHLAPDLWTIRARSAPRWRFADVRCKIVLHDDECAMSATTGRRGRAPCGENNMSLLMFTYKSSCPMLFHLWNYQLI